MVKSEEIKKVNELIQAVAKGDKQALSDLFVLEAPNLKNFARMYLTDKSLADDVVSEVFIKVATKSHLYNPSYSGINWLLEVTKNTAYNINRSYLRRATHPLEYETETMGEDFPWNKLVIGELLEKLDEKEKKLIYMHYWEGRTMRDIAQIVGVTKSTVHRNITAIIEKLRSGTER